jgi:SAM-dependent methyltransferase
MRLLAPAVMTIAREIRKACPVCEAQELVALQSLDGFPILPLCVDAPIGADVLLPLEAVLCDECGLLQLRTLAPRDVIYAAPHSEGIGATWAEHYRSFEAFLVGSSRIAPDAQVLEVGAGKGQIAERLADRCDLTVIEPNYQGSRAGLKTIEDFFDPARLTGHRAAFDVVYSSHTLEHFYDFREYFAAAAQVLRHGGKLVTAVPNLESALQAGYANALNFEHTAMLTLPHLQRLHGEFGFELAEIAYYRDHGIYLAARKTDQTASVATDTREYMRYLFGRFLDQLNRVRSTIEARLRPGVPRYLFGASQLSQFLFVLGLDARQFDGLLDNARQKHGRRLYGTPLRCELPDEVLPGLERGQIFINGGPYTREIHQQLANIARKQVELIPL